MILPRLRIWINTVGFIVRHSYFSKGMVDPYLNRFRLPDFSRLRSELGEISESGFFDPGFYLRENPWVRDSGIDPATHFLVSGWREGLDPSPEFSLAFYLENYPEVRESGVNPILHHIREGQGKGLYTSAQGAYRGRIDMEVYNLVHSGMFDADYYRIMNPDLKPFPTDPIRHYCEQGWREGRNPRDDFDGVRYHDEYKDVKEDGINPFWYYVVTGGKASERPMPKTRDPFQDDSLPYPVESDVILVAFHSNPDWPAVRRSWELAVDEAKELARLPHEDLGFYEASDPAVLLRQSELAKSHGIGTWCFSVDGGRLGKGSHPLGAFLSNPDIGMDFILNVSLVDSDLDETCAVFLSDAMTDRRYLHIDGRPALVITLPSDAGSIGSAMAAIDSLVSRGLIPEPYRIARTDAHGARLPLSMDGGVVDSFLRFPQEPDPGETGDYPLVESNGSCQVPYSVVAFQAIASMAAVDADAAPVYQTVTAGRNDSPLSPSRKLMYTRPDVREYRRWLDAAIRDARYRHPADRRLVFLNSWNDWNQGSALEPDHMRGYALLNETTLALLDMPPGTSVPKVSVIVTDYRRSPDLKRRLDNIYGQSYHNYEVILLDDGMTEESEDAVPGTEADQSKVTRIYIDPEWSGDLQRQWMEGIRVATGDLIWIAGNEADCSEDFLKTLVLCFEDESVMLAYSKTVFVHDDGSVDMPSLEGYLQIASSPRKWEASYVNTGHREVSECLGIIKSIPSPSSMVFKRPVDMGLFEDAEWRSMRLLGDWVLCLHLIRGARIAYSTEAVNHCRRHEAFIKHEPITAEWFARELNAVLRTVCRLYDVPSSLIGEWRRVFGRNLSFLAGLPEAGNVDLPDEETVTGWRRTRTPNIAVFTLGFRSGGAEILPIRMANEFKRTGHSVLLVSIGYGKRVKAVRSMARNDIPVVETSDVDLVMQTLIDFGIEVLNTHDWNIQKYPLANPDVFRNIKCHVACLHGMIENAEIFTVTSEELDAADANVTTWVYTADKNLKPFIDNGMYEASPHRFVKLPNGMSPPVIKRVQRSELGIPEDAFVLCCVSRAIPQKGWAEAIEAVARARDISGRDIRLILVGNGPLYDAYVESGVPFFVYLAGFNENSVGFYAASDAGIMLTTYRSESFPLTVVDCFFAGRPYISTDLGEIREMLTVDGGLAGEVVELEDWTVPVERVAQIVARLSVDGDAMGALRERVAAAADKYRIDRVSKRYEYIFERDLKALS